MSQLDFQPTVQAFMDYLRHDDVPSSALQGIDIERLNLYQTLVTNNIFRFIDTCYVLAPQWLQQQQHGEMWEDLKQQFFQNAEQSSPYFVDIPHAFLQFCQSQQVTLSSDFLALMQFEYRQLCAEIATSNTTHGNHSDDENHDLSQLLKWETSAFLLELPSSLTPLLFAHATDENDEFMHILVWRTPDFKVLHQQLEPLQVAFLQHFSQQNEASTTQQLLEQLIEINADLAQYADWLASEQNHWLQQGVLCRSE